MPDEEWWDNAAKVALETALGYVPYVGGILSGLLEIFWPSGEDVWGKIRKQVEALINKKIAENVYQTVKDDLAGLHNVINDYVDTLATKDYHRISASWTSAQQIFDYALPHFQSQGYEILLLPLLAGFGNLYFGLLRDGVLFGTEWGWNQASMEQIQKKLTEQLGHMITYVEKTFAKGKENAKAQAGNKIHDAQPWRGLNSYIRSTTLSVLDFSFYWPYFDPSVYPNPVKVTPQREIFGNPHGSLDNKGSFNPPGAGGKTIAAITVWGWDRIDGVKVDYTDGSSTGRQGNQGGGSNKPPAGGAFNTANDPITKVGPISGDIVNALKLTSKSGWTSGKIAGFYKGGTQRDESFKDHILTSIYVHGTSKFYGCIDCIAFGFRFAPHSETSERNLEGLAALYMSSPLAQHYGDVAGFLAQIGVKDEAVVAAAVARAEGEGWDLRRKSFHEARKVELKMAKKKLQFQNFE